MSENYIISGVLPLQIDSSSWLPNNLECHHLGNSHGRGYLPEERGHEPAAWFQSPCSHHYAKIPKICEFFQHEFKFQKLNSSIQS